MCRAFGVLLRGFSCSSFALSLGSLAMLVVVLFSVHHGSLIYRCISSIVSATYCGYCLTRCSRLEVNVLLFVILQYLIAFSSHIFVGCFFGSVWTWVRYFMVCLRSSSSIGRSSVSCCKAAVDVVLKHPVIVFMASRCTDVRLLTCDEIGEFRLSSGLCHIAAP